MRAITNLLASGAAIAAFAIAAPAAAQYYPPYGSPGYGVPGGGYGYGADNQFIVNQCIGAVQARLNPNGYGYGYGYGAYGGGRVLGVTRVEPRESGRGIRVWGTATSGFARPYGYNRTPTLTWSCRTDFRGRVVDVDLKPGAYGYEPYGDYSQYGYRRY